jgi:CRISPR/Cas system CMR-associated protein Cmr5 small subunit
MPPCPIEYFFYKKKNGFLSACLGKRNRNFILIAFKVLNNSVKAQDHSITESYSSHIESKVDIVDIVGWLLLVTAVQFPHQKLRIVADDAKPIE